MGIVKFPKKTIRDVEVSGKTVLLRTDFNVPMRGTRIMDDFRLQSSLVTIKYLIEHNARVVIISHLGRPENRKDFRFSLATITERLEKLLNQPVKFIDDCTGDKVKLAVKKMSLGDVVLLENLRFYDGEEANDENFARQVVKSSGASLFVQDGFGAIHREHASIAAITNFLPSVAGLLIEKEYLVIENAIKNPNRPLVAIIGGAKIKDKTPIIEKFIDVADQVVIGGAIANNFLMKLGFPIGASLWEMDMDDVVEKILTKAKDKFGKDFNKHFIIPIDVAVSKNGNPASARHVVARQKVAANNAILDMGTKSISRVTEVIKNAGTVVWNGTMGLAEKAEFAVGSAKIAETLANNPQIYSLIGGGDTSDFVRHWDKLDGGSFSYISTGGGASLELIAGKRLPGIENLIDR